MNRYLLEWKPDNCQIVTGDTSEEAVLEFIKSNRNPDVAEAHFSVTELYGARFFKAKPLAVECTSDPVMQNSTTMPNVENSPPDDDIPF